MPGCQNDKSRREKLQISKKTFPISQKVVTFKSYYLPRDTRLFTTHSNIYVYYTISHA